MKTLKEIIHNGGVAIIKTDTLYGIIADAHNPQAVARVYEIKKRNLLKPVIVLVADYSDIESFGITISPSLQKQLEKYWPGKVSVILETEDKGVHTHHIHKGTGGIAFRIPQDKDLRNLLREIGPVIAPSANPEGEPPAKNIQEAAHYFGDAVDYYRDGGEVMDERPSKIIKINENIDVEVIRD